MRFTGLVILALWTGLAWGDPAGTLEARQADAQKQQQALRERIVTLQKQIDQQEASRQDAASQLKESETAISTTNRRLDELAQQKRKAELELARLADLIAGQEEQLAQRQAELAEQLRNQYASGLSPWTALLSGDDPQAIGRDLAYLSYISQAQADAVRAVRTALTDLIASRNQASARRSELADVEAETRQQKKALQTQQAERQRVLAKIEAQLKQQRAQAGTMQLDEKRLGRLITGLEAAIEKQREEARLAEERRKAEAARQAEEARRQAVARQQEVERQREQAREAQRQAREAQARAQREQDEEQARQARLQVEQAREQAQQAEQAARMERERERAAQQPAQAPGPTQAASMNGLRKGLPFPVRGEVQGRFGAERPDGGVWRGIVLRAGEGAPVRPIAPGRVVYANWLKGFGNIMIVDHGQSYLSVYAYNQSLLKQVGDAVSPGDTIATVGATGGQVESGLYFEIRHNGAPVNPLLWLSR